MRRTGVQWVRRHRSALLMCAFVAQILASPLADKDAHVGALLALALLTTLLVGAGYLANRRIVRLVVVPVGALWVVARALEAFGDHRHVYTQLAPVMGLALSCAVLWGILDRFYSIPLVIRGVLSEAFICYLIIAVAFSQLYSVLSRLVPHAFNEFIPYAQSSTFLYFSMDTLSGVGSGNIAPVDPYIRLIAGLENMIGIFFLAVVVSRLVSSHPSRTRRSARGSHRSHNGQN
jgi:hypothetical protein